MAIVHPERPDSAQKTGTGGQFGASEAAPSDSGMGLEATLPSVPPRPSSAQPLTSLDEPSGAFAPPASPVPESELKNIFLPFYRIAGARDRQSGGAGLGLAIAERVVRTHGGTVRAENALPRGLRIEIVLPKSRVLDAGSGPHDD